MGKNDLRDELARLGKKITDLSIDAVVPVFRTRIFLHGGAIPRGEELRLLTTLKRWREQAAQQQAPGGVDGR